MKSQISAPAFGTDPEISAQAAVDHLAGRHGVDLAWYAQLDYALRAFTVEAVSGSGSRLDLPLEFSLDDREFAGARRIGERDQIFESRVGSVDGPIPADLIEACEADGVDTIAWVPVEIDESLSGFLAIGGRAPVSAQSEAGAALLERAAELACFGRGGADEERRTAQMAQALMVIGRINVAAPGSDGIDGVAAELRNVLDLDVVVLLDDEPVHGRLYPAGEASVEPLSIPASELDRSRSAVVAPIVGSSRRLGEIHLEGAEPAQAMRIVVKHAAAVCASILMRERAGREAEWEYRGDLLEELIRSGGEPDDEVRGQADRLGVDLARPRCVAVLEPRDGGRVADLATLLRTAWRSGGLEGEPLMTERRTAILIAVELNIEEAAGAVESMLGKAGRAGIETAAGVSSVRLDLAVAAREAEAALNVARTSPEAGKLMRHDQFGPLRFLLDAPGTEESASLVRSLLGNLVEHDEARRGALLETLRAYLQTGGHHKRTSEACMIHVSTLKYRLGRIRELLGRSVADPRARFELSLGFEILDLLRNLGEDPFE